ncbi:MULTISPECIES: hypothetical protein [Burkholderia]|uniref:Uncharacterized protein n=1 Tax=Burkholderia contaminans TaxID=488447 RepID=A0AAP1YB52_9BURK|nr:MULTISPECIES: hypothetical protein [Burkholderia]MBK1902023.1 hypothetical protein [Burkholderia contaminans]MBK1910306.1 hypothetical protein [Burkholderia contaminans]MBK1923765.1 hypothetical protein [Burkholderia contaminans]MBK1931977.1 hypothetical protein [Burkholderia contaminans]MBK1939226.1 hypothetical protein [Burkholderia contaminans]
MAQRYQVFTQRGTAKPKFSAPWYWAASLYGWSSRDGMTAVAGWCSLRDLGVCASSTRRPRDRTTVAALLPGLHHERTFINDVTEHCFVVRKGIVIDRANAHPRTVVRNYIELASN